MARPKGRRGFALAAQPGQQSVPFGRSEIEAAIGTQVRSIRRTRELTAVELARQAGVSTGMLSKIERGQAAPSIATLAALAHALNVPVARFFATFEDRRDYSYVKAGRGLAVERRGTRSGHSYQLLGHSLSGELFVEPYLVTTTRKAQPYSSFQHKGVEFLYVLDGSMTYRYADQVFDLGPGDSMLFDSTALHGPEALTVEPVRYLSIVFNLRS